VSAAGYDPANSIVRLVSATGYFPDTDSRRAAAPVISRV